MLTNFIYPNYFHVMRLIAISEARTSCFYLNEVVTFIMNK